MEILNQQIQLIWSLSNTNLMFILWIDFLYICLMDQDDDDNITRFLILAREPIIPGTDRPYKVL